MKKKEVSKQIQGFRSGTMKPENENLNWKAQEVALLNSMFYRGKSISEIAVALSRFETAVMQKLIQEGCYEQAVNHRTRKESSDNNKCRCSSCPVYGSIDCKLCMSNGSCDYLSKETAAIES